MTGIVAASPYPPISDYALLGDCHSAALVSLAGSVDWCCFHRFDAHPSFGRLLDWRRGGHFQIQPAGAATVTRRYLPETNVLETHFTTETGVFTVTDCMPVHLGSGLHPYHQLLRHVVCDEGTVTVNVEFAPRFDFGLIRPHIEPAGRGLWQVYGGASSLVFQCPLPLEEADTCTYTASAVMRTGEDHWLVVTSMPPHRLVAELIDPDLCEDRLARTIAFWRDWSAQCAYDGPYRDAVLRSALVLKGLTNGPTGAIVAAPTTSLPECIGGTRNWDYRYTWLRDATIELYALFRLGYTEEAHQFMDWLQRTTAGRCDDLQILYGIGGEHFVAEMELTGIEGYRGSAPVRVGNAAVGQFQLDVYGHVLDAAWQYHRHGGEISDAFWSFLCGVVDVVSQRWRDPDAGIWEVRSDPEHFVLSKVMAWVACDRAIRLAGALGREAGEGWAVLRDAIRADVDAHATGPSGAFKRAYGDERADAANLLIPLVGFVHRDDPRLVATVETVRTELDAGGLVYRYRGASDGFDEGEGAFLICNFWLVGNLARVGDLDEAHAVFERLLGYCNDVGLLAEEVDPSTGSALGNFPQAFSHVGLIGAAFNLLAAEQRHGPPPQRSPSR